MHLKATVLFAGLASSALMATAMPVIHINTGPQWSTGSVAPAPQPETGIVHIDGTATATTVAPATVPDMTARDSTGLPSAATAQSTGSAATTKPGARPVSFSVDTLALHNADSSTATSSGTGAVAGVPGSTLYSSPQSGTTTPGASTSTGLTTGTGFATTAGTGVGTTTGTGTGTSGAPSTSSLNSDPTGWDAAMTDAASGQSAAGATTGMTGTGTGSFGTGMSTTGTGMSTGVGGATTGTGTFTPVTVAGATANPDADRLSAIAQQTAAGAAAGGLGQAMSSGSPFGTSGSSPFGTGTTTGTGFTSGTGVSSGGAGGVVDPFTLQSQSILGSTAGGTTSGGVTAGTGTGTTGGFTGTTGTTTGTGTSGGDVGLGVQTRRNV